MSMQPQSLLSLYWQIGKYIILDLQRGKTRAANNTQQALSSIVAKKFGVPFNDYKITYAKKFFIFFPFPLAPLNEGLTTSPQNQEAEKTPLGCPPNLSRTAGGAGGNTQPCYPPLSESLSRPFGGRLGEALTWSHYIEILKSRDKPEANFYHQQTIQNKWSTRQLKQQMKNNLYYTVSTIAHHISQETFHPQQPTYKASRPGAPL